jgi:ring-1,2-phenylacetyl-CoA epoxidase subunit PaaE
LLFQPENVAEYFLCGPEQMIFSVKDALENQGVDSNRIKFELFTTPVEREAEKQEMSSKEEESTISGESSVTLILDDEEYQYSMKPRMSILDAAIENDVDAPYSCKGAVCSTCKARVLKGKARMDMNYALLDDEVNSGYILTCQSHPLTDELTVSFDD